MSSNTSDKRGPRPSSGSRPRYTANHSSLASSSRLAATPVKKGSGTSPIVATSSFATPVRPLNGASAPHPTPLSLPRAGQTSAASFSTRRALTGPSAYERFDEVEWLVDLSSRIKSALQASPPTTSTSPSARRDGRTFTPASGTRRPRLSRLSREFLELQQSIKRRKGHHHPTDLADETAAEASPSERRVREVPSPATTAPASAQEWAKVAQQEFEKRQAAMAVAAAARAEAEAEAALAGFSDSDSDVASEAVPDPVVERTRMAAESLKELFSGGGLEADDDEQLDFAELLGTAEPLAGQPPQSQGPSSLFESFKSEDGAIDIHSILQHRARLAEQQASSESAIPVGGSGGALSLLASAGRSGGEKRSEAGGAPLIQEVDSSLATVSDGEQPDADRARMNTTLLDVEKGDSNEFDVGRGPDETDARQDALVVEVEADDDGESFDVDEQEVNELDEDDEPAVGAPTFVADSDSAEGERERGRDAEGEEDEEAEDGGDEDDEGGHANLLADYRANQEAPRRMIDGEADVDEERDDDSEDGSADEDDDEEDEGEELESDDEYGEGVAVGLRYFPSEGPGDDATEPIVLSDSDDNDEAERDDARPAAPPATRSEAANGGAHGCDTRYIEGLVHSFHNVGSEDEVEADEVDEEDGMDEDTAADFGEAQYAQHQAPGPPSDYPYLDAAVSVPPFGQGLPSFVPASTLLRSTNSIAAPAIHAAAAQPEVDKRSHSTDTAIQDDFISSIDPALFEALINDASGFTAAFSAPFAAPAVPAASTQPTQSTESAAIQAFTTPAQASAHTEVEDQGGEQTRSDAATTVSSSLQAADVPVEGLDDAKPGQLAHAPAMEGQAEHFVDPAPHSPSPEPMQMAEGVQSPPATQSVGRHDFARERSLPRHDLDEDLAVQEKIIDEAVTLGDGPAAEGATAVVMAADEEEAASPPPTQEALSLLLSERSVPDEDVVSSIEEAPIRDAAAFALSDTAPALSETAPATTEEDAVLLGVPSDLKEGTSGKGAPASVSEISAIIEAAAPVKAASPFDAAASAEETEAVEAAPVVASSGEDATAKDTPMDQGPIEEPAAVEDAPTGDALVLETSASAVVAAPPVDKEPAAQAEETAAPTLNREAVASFEQGPPSRKGGSVFGSSPLSSVATLPPATPRRTISGLMALSTLPPSSVLRHKHRHHHGPVRSMLPPGLSGLPVGGIRRRLLSGSTSGGLEPVVEVPSSVTPLGGGAFGSSSHGTPPTMTTSDPPTAEVKGDGAGSATASEQPRTESAGADVADLQGDEDEEEEEESHGPSTRSQCSFRRLRFHRLPNQPTFIVPQCSIMHDVAREEGARDVGEAKADENEIKIDFDPDELPLEIRHSLSRIIGFQMLPDAAVVPGSSAAALLIRPEIEPSSDVDEDVGVDAEAEAKRIGTAETDATISELSPIKALATRHRRTASATSLSGRRSPTKKLKKPDTDAADARQQTPDPPDADRQLQAHLPDQDVQDGDPAESARSASPQTPPIEGPAAASPPGEKRRRSRGSRKKSTDASFKPPKDEEAEQADSEDEVTATTAGSVQKARGRKKRSASVAKAPPSDKPAPASKREACQTRAKRPRRSKRGDDGAFKVQMKHDRGQAEDEDEDEEEGSMVTGVQTRKRQQEEAEVLDQIVGSKTIEALYDAIAAETQVTEDEEVDGMDVDDEQVEQEDEEAEADAEDAERSSEPVAEMEEEAKVSNRKSSSGGRMKGRSSMGDSESQSIGATTSSQAKKKKRKRVDRKSAAKR